MSTTPWSQKTLNIARTRLQELNRKQTQDDVLEFVEDRARLVRSIWKLARELNGEGKQ